MQFHTGFGDRGTDLRVANPLHLRRVIEQARCPLVLLHAGWPFYRDWPISPPSTPMSADLSLRSPLPPGIPPIIRDVLGMAPWGKVMFATDMFTMPEIFWLAARWGR